MRTLMHLVMAAVVLAMIPAFAQPPEGPPPDGQGPRMGPGGGRGPGGGGPGGRGGRGGDWDPARMMERQMERIQERLGFTGEEWQAVQPLMKNTIEAGMKVRMGRGPGGGRRGPAPSPEAEALRNALDAEDTPAEEIKSKLKALRDARVKDEAALKASRAKLREVLTAKQEAHLVLMGILD